MLHTISYRTEKNSGLLYVFNDHVQDLFFYMAHPQILPKKGSQKRIPKTNINKNKQQTESHFLKMIPKKFFPTKKKTFFFSKKNSQFFFQNMSKKHVFSQAWAWQVSAMAQVEELHQRHRVAPTFCCAKSSMFLRFKNMVNSCNSRYYMV